MYKRQSLTRGKFVYDFCDTGMVCPLAKMYTLGSGFIPSPNHAGGLRYHGMSSILSQLYHDGLMEARSVEQTSVFEDVYKRQGQRKRQPCPKGTTTGFQARVLNKHQFPGFFVSKSNTKSINIGEKYHV